MCVCVYVNVCVCECVCVTYRDVEVSDVSACCRGNTKSIMGTACVPCISGMLTATRAYLFSTACLLGITSKQQVLPSKYLCFEHGLMGR